VLVIAFDGVLFDSLGARAMVLSDALVAEGLVVEEESVRDAIAGRTLSEAVRFIAHRARENAASRTLDDTSLDIATIRAGQAYAALANRGFSLNTGVRDTIQRAATITRVVLRADSRRREADSLLAFAGLETAVSMTRCSDDPAPRSAGSDSHPDFLNSLRHSYEAIAGRMRQNGALLGERGPVGVAIESTVAAKSIAAEFGFDIAESVSALDFPAR
jgi:beta-phosphoglucomutase-like phosphatase (HAD superfamily)